MRAVILQHDEASGLGLAEPALKAAGFSLVNRFRTVKHEDASAELVVALGGAMGAYDTEQHPFLAHELSLFSQRLASGLPCLGLCLGAQLLAAAAGAQVSRGKNGLELGVSSVRWTQAALEDPVLAGVRAKLPVAHWHEDTYSAVPGAVLLASTDRYTQQGFRLGNSYAFQFHAELSADALGAWYDESRAELEAQGKNIDALKAELPKLKGAESDLRALWSRVAEHFAQLATSR